LGVGIDAHHIRTVLNLRGAGPSQKWCQHKLAATSEHGSQRYDIGLSALPGSFSRQPDLSRCETARAEASA
jgi:hypothetical protein